MGLAAVVHYTRLPGLGRLIIVHPATILTRFLVSESLTKVWGKRLRWCGGAVRIMGKEQSALSANH